MNQENSNQQTKELNPIAKRAIGVGIIAIINVLVYLLFQDSLSDSLGNSFQGLFGDFQFYRLITSVFLHGSFSHLWSNTISLLVIGFAFIRKHRVSQFFVTYFVGGILANLISALFYPLVLGQRDVVSVGASGAIFSVLGGVVIFSLFMERGRSRFDGLIYAVALILVNASLANVDNVAHIAGFCSGAVIELIRILRIIRQN